jgi:hypothetical protein
MLRRSSGCFDTNPSPEKVLIVQGANRHMKTNHALFQTVTLTIQRHQVWVE